MNLGEERLGTYMLDTHSEIYDFGIDLIAEPDATLWGINSSHVEGIQVILINKVFFPIFGTFARKL